jgi:aromatic-L-amino-acid/L-tryptophan decarboxylase
MSFDMPPDEFRRAGHDVVDWIADYLAGIRDFPVMTSQKPGGLVDALPASAPEKGESMDRILAGFRDHVVPDVTHWNHPRFFAYFSVSASGPGILGEMLAAALNVNGMLWKSCPATTELEQVTMSWLRQWMGLPSDWFGLIYDTASISSFHAIAAAREAAFPEVRMEGGTGNGVVYTSEHSHSSIEKGAIALGVGQKNVRRIGTDARFRMRPDLLEAAIQHDLANGKKPFFVTATVGTTSTTSVDPVPSIADIAERYGLWLHVDAAYGGSACVVPEFQHFLSGAERADSLVTNPHKWMFTPIDISVFYTRRPEILRRAFSLVPEYLKTAEDPRALNLMDYGVQLGRRFRALKFWFVLRYFGHEGICAIIREHVRLAQEFAAWVQSDPRFEVCAPHPLSLVCFRLKAGDEANRRLLDAVNASGTAFLSHTVLHGKYVLRLAIGNIKTTQEDVELTWKALQEEAGRALAAGA